MVGVFLGLLLVGGGILLLAPRLQPKDGSGSPSSPAEGIGQRIAEWLERFGPRKGGPGDKPSGPNPV